MKGDTDEALLLNVLALDIKFDGAVGELNPLQVCDAVASAFTEPHTFPSPLVEAAYAAVEDLQAFAVGKRSEIRLDRFLLTDTPGNRGESKGAGKRRDDEITSFMAVLRSSSTAIQRSARAETAGTVIPWVKWSRGNTRAVRHRGRHTVRSYRATDKKGRPHRGRRRR